MIIAERKPGKMQHCFNCGEELGVYVHYHGDIECCGSRECDRELQAELRVQREEAMLRAEQDDYVAYR